MQKIISGIHHFQDQVFASQEQMFQRLARGQHPLALFITCSDSRICPNALTQTDPGELFVLRNAGNIVPAYGAGRGGEAATVEYAVAALKVQHIVVCGHSLCGAMGALLEPQQTDELPAVREWLGHAESTRRIIRENYQHIEPGPARLMAAIEENVLAQLENLRTHPAVAAALSRDALKLHGWVYKFETGKVSAYCPTRKQFAPLEEVEQATEAVASSKPSN